MKNDVLNWAEGENPKKLISKETLNHRRIIERVTGLDVYAHTKEAYLGAYKALGIDLINRVPLENAPPPTPEEESRRHPSKPYDFSALGVYDTAVRHTYLCTDPGEVWDLNMDRVEYDDLMTPVPHSCGADDIHARQTAVGEIGLYYPMLYTTLFMWGVELLGWETFMVAATEEAGRFHNRFLLPCARKSQHIVSEMATATGSPFVFLHDDLAVSTGPVFRPAWYDEYIFPLYPEIFGPAKAAGKRIIFVADGDMTLFLPKLLEVGVDGLMFENPATPLDAVIEHFGQEGRIFIGGVETSKLTFGNPEEIKRMVFDLAERMQDYEGFAMASCGGLHGNIPIANLEAYFDARAEVGATPRDWRSHSRIPG